MLCRGVRRCRVAYTNAARGSRWAWKPCSRAWRPHRQPAARDQLAEQRGGHDGRGAARDGGRRGQPRARAVAGVQRIEQHLPPAAPRRCLRTLAGRRAGAGPARGPAPPPTSERACMGADLSCPSSCAALAPAVAHGRTPTCQHCSTVHNTVNPAPWALSARSAVTARRSSRCGARARCASTDGPGLRRWAHA